MTSITLTSTHAVFEPQGWSRVWALKRRIEVPLAAIRLVRRAPAGVGSGWWKGLRLPGTHLPGVIVAGSYLVEGKWEFWDVRGEGRSAIEVHLSGTRYSRLVVDVADPDAEVRRLLAAPSGGR